MVRTYNVDSSLLTREFYEETLQKALMLFTNVPGLVSVYQFGSVTVPGNSDIDLMLVIEPSRETARSLLSVLEERFTQAEKFILYQHDPLITSREVAPLIHYVRGCSQLTHLLGEEYEFDGNLDCYARLYLLVELLTQYYPRIFFLPNRDTRLRFQHINAFRFPFTLFMDLNRELSICNLNRGFVSRVSQVLSCNDVMRRTFYSLAAEEVSLRITAMEREIVGASRELIGEVGRFAQKLGERALSDRPVRMRDRLFMEGADGTCSTVTFGNRSIRFWGYPISYLPFFTGRLHGAVRAPVEKRNRVVSKYCKFIDQFTDGRNLYYPWWCKRESLSSRLVRAVAACIPSCNTER